MSATTEMHRASALTHWMKAGQAAVDSLLVGQISMQDIYNACSQAFQEPADERLPDLHLPHQPQEPALQLGSKHTPCARAQRVCLTSHRARARCQGRSGARTFILSVPTRSTVLKRGCRKRLVMSRTQLGSVALNSSVCTPAAAPPWFRICAQHGQSGAQW